MTITVFLADDHTVVRDGLRVLLEAEQDIDVIGDASNGRDAVRAIGRLRPNVVLMDVTMPELNGIEATSQVQQVCPSAHVIILSMHETLGYIVRALRAGARGYLLKEAAGTEVVAAVRDVCSGHRYLSRKLADSMIDDYMRQGKTVDVQNPIELLSSREMEVLQLTVEGESTARIADALALSPKTVETYRSRLMKKLDIGDLPSLVKFAIKQGVTPLE